MRRAILLLAAVVALLLVWAQASGSIDRAVLAIRILDDLRRPEKSSWLDRVRSAPAPREVEWVGTHGAFKADVYRSAESGRAMPLVFVPGAVALGKDDPRVEPFARLLAQAGFSVIVPDLPSLRTLRVQRDNLEELVSATVAIASRPEFAPDRRVGLFGVSYSGGLAIVAALDPRLRNRVSFVATLGAYADLDTMVRFLADGRIVDDGVVRQLTPDPYARMVMAKTFQQFLDRTEDRAGIDAMIERRTADPHAPLADLADRLSPEARVIHDLFERAGPEEAADLIENFPSEMKRLAERLSPSRHDFTELEARLYLAHDLRDATIPFTESRRIAALARSHQPVRLLLLDTVRHVAPEPWQGDAVGFLTRDLPEAWRMVGWWWHLLGERGHVAKT